MLISLLFSPLFPTLFVFTSSASFSAICLLFLSEFKLSITPKFTLKISSIVLFSFGLLLFSLLFICDIAGILISKHDKKFCQLFSNPNCLLFSFWSSFVPLLSLWFSLFTSLELLFISLLLFSLITSASLLFSILLLFSLLFFTLKKYLVSPTTIVIIIVIFTRYFIMSFKLITAILIILIYFSFVQVLIY